MKNVLVLFMVLVLIGSVSAEMLNNPETFDQYADGTVLWDGGPVDGWEGWGSGGDPWVGGNDTGTVSNSTGNAGTVVVLPKEGPNWGYGLLFNHDNELASLPGAPAPGDTFELRFDLISGGSAGVIKLEFYDDAARSGQDVALIEDPIDLGEPGTKSFTVTIPDGKFYLTPVLGTTGLGTSIELDNIWIGKEGSFAPGKATSPNPSNGDTVGSNLAELSWINPDPNDPENDQIEVEVWILGPVASQLSGDPNMGPIVFEDPLTGELAGAEYTQLADGDTINTIDLDALPASVGGGTYSLDDNKYYYWAVHCTDPNGGVPVTTIGDAWYFDTGDAKPVVNAGPDEFAWVAKDDGEDADPTTYTFVLTGTYTDDGKSAITDANFVNLNAGLPDGVEKIYQEWTHNGPGGTNVPPDIEPHTAGTVIAKYRSASTTIVPGWWDMQLEVTDTSGTGIDVAYLRLEADCAAAADADGSDDFDTTYDINRDCINNIEDFAAFAAVWLDQSVKYE